MATVPLILDTNFPQPTNAVTKLRAVDNTTLYISGGKSLFTLPGGSLYDLALYDDVYFYDVGGIPRDCLAAIDLTTNTLTSFDITPLLAGYPNPVIFDFVILNNIIYAVGTKDYADTSGASALTLAVDFNGNVQPWAPIVTHAPSFPLKAACVNAITTDGTDIYITGYFDSVNGDTRNGIAKIDSTAGLTISWDPSPTSGEFTGKSLQLFNNTLYAVGLSATSPTSTFAFDTTTATLTAWDPDTLLGGGSYKLVRELDGSLYVSATGMSLVTNTAKTDATTGALDPGFSAEVINDFYAKDNVLYAGGLSAFIGLDKLNGSNVGLSLPITTTPSYVDGINTVEFETPIQDLVPRVFIGGSFVTIDPGTQVENISYLAAFNTVPVYPKPMPPKIDFLLRRRNNTFLQWKNVLMDVDFNEIEVDGYKVYRSINANQESFELVETITAKNANNRLRTFFSEKIAGYYGYGVSAFVQTKESDISFVKAVNSNVGPDLL